MRACQCCSDAGGGRTCCASLSLRDENLKRKNNKKLQTYKKETKTCTYIYNSLSFFQLPREVNLLPDTSIFLSKFCLYFFEVLKFRRRKYFRSVNYFFSGNFLYQDERFFREVTGKTKHCYYNDYYYVLGVIIIVIVMMMSVL